MTEDRHMNRQYMRLAMHVGLLYVCPRLGPRRDPRRAAQMARVDFACWPHPLLLAVDSDR